VTAGVGLDGRDCPGRRQPASRAEATRRTRQRTPGRADHPSSSGTTRCCRPSRCVHLLASLCASGMTDVGVLTVSAARAQLAAIIDQARSDHTPVYLARRGRRVAAVIDADDLDAVLALAEDMADIRAAADARAEMAATGPAPIPWDQVKADLGLS